jgi:hypothetical protein
MLHNQPIPFVIRHDGLFTDRYRVLFRSQPTLAVAQELEFSIADLKAGEIAGSVTLPAGLYEAQVVTAGPGGETPSAWSAPFSVFVPAPNVALLVLVFQVPSGPSA